MQRVIFCGIILCWSLVSYGLSTLITGYREGIIIIWLLILVSPFYLRAVHQLQRRLINRPCILNHHKHKSRMFLHLHPGQPTVGISSERVVWFWNGMLESVAKALRENDKNLVIASHLLTSCRIKRIRESLQPGFYRSHVIYVPFTPAARAVMQLEILLAQWRWRVPSRTVWPVLVIQKSFNPHNKTRVSARRSQGCRPY